VRIEKLRKIFNIYIKLVHFPLHPETPIEGRSVAEMYAARGMDPKAMYERMKGLMDKEGLPYGQRANTYNSRRAQELGKWADTQDGGDAIHEELYRAYFVANHNIADFDVLVDLVETVGLSGSDARKALDEERFKDAVDADWEKSRSYGVTGVPTFVAGGYGVVGAQPYEAIAHMLQNEAGAQLREST